MNSTLQRYYSGVRQKNAALSEQRLSECEKKNPRFKSLREERGEVVLAMAAGKLSAAQAQSRIAAISAERKNLLIAMGQPANYLDPIYSCPKCKDTGEVGEGRKKLCACALKQMQQTLAEGARINPKETFAAFRADLYPTDAQRSFGIRCKAYCEKYVASLPHPEKPNLIFLGTPGLGKTYFANAIAYGALERGIDTLKVTAYRFVQDALDGIGSHTETMRRYTDVSLLVLDDLGTEPMIPNVTVESLFRVLNERNTADLPTIVVSNLTREDLVETYGERLASRLFDGSRTAIVKFSGNNLRTRQS
ncbi:MAG: ATP-binding protein [Clostridia bacterium]|nr:ATP-binding protein [Clostridia bacterium]